jgi:hypothetical protein
MTFSDDCPCGRSQFFTLPRRGFLQKAASVALLFLTARSQLIVAALKGRALPKFSLGDKVATDWSDDWGGHYLDFGEVVGNPNHYPSRGNAIFPQKILGFITSSYLGIFENIDRQDVKTPTRNFLRFEGQPPRISSKL